MEEAQRRFEQKAMQFREISQRMRRGVVNAMRSGELERLVGEMTLVLEDQVGASKEPFECSSEACSSSFGCFLIGFRSFLPCVSQAESIRSRVRKGLLRAHRKGELVDLRQDAERLIFRFSSIRSFDHHNKIIYHVTCLFVYKYKF